MNVKLLRTVQKHIVEEPDRFSMSDWKIEGEPGDTIQEFERSEGQAGRTFPRCGTVACIAGWATVLSGSNPALWEIALFAALDLKLAAPKMCSEVSKNKSASSDRLFFVSAWPARFRRAYRAAEKDGSTKRMAAAASQRIDHFIATRGRE